MLDEQEELSEEIIERWVETHKKSMTMFAVMVGLSTGPMWSKELLVWLKNVMEWDITERGLHRVLQRMTHLGLIAYRSADSPKSGADRKVYQVTTFGLSIARAIRDTGLSYMHDIKFTTAVEKL